MLNIKEIENILGYTFKNKSLVISATTHKSYAVEKKLTDMDSYNERLEYLGDAILEHAVSIILFNETPKLTEGVMSKKRSEIVCEASLSAAVISCGLDKFIKIGNCDIASGNKKNIAILADMAEALIAAIYLDSSFLEAYEFVVRLLGKNIQEILKSDTYNHDYKTQLQEKLQENGSVKIEYVITDEQGQAHKKQFTSSVYLEGKKLGEGVGTTKKAAEQQAAKQALESM